VGGSEAGPRARSRACRDALVSRRTPNPGSRGEGDRVPLVAHAPRRLPAPPPQAPEELLERGLRGLRRRDAPETRRVEGLGDHEWRRLSVAVELLGEESRLSPLPHDGHERTPPSRPFTGKADEPELVPRSAGLDGPPSAGLQSGDEQLMGCPHRAAAAKPTQPRNTEGGRVDDGSARTVRLRDDHLKLAVAARGLVDDRAPVRPGWTRAFPSHARRSMSAEGVDQLLLVHRRATLDAGPPGLLVELPPRLLDVHCARCPPARAGFGASSHVRPHARGSSQLQEQRRARYPMCAAIRGR
jgi:hypothetical protein